MKARRKIVKKFKKTEFTEFWFQCISVHLFVENIFKIYRYKPWFEKWRKIEKINLENL